MKAPKIILVVRDRERNARIAAVSPDMLELRVDLFGKADIAYARAQFQLRRKLGIPLILTVRNQKEEGAVRAFSDARKWGLMQELLPLTDWVDIELSSGVRRQVIDCARRHKKRIILSAHDFKRMPGALNVLLKKGLSLRGDMVKIAACAGSPEDLVRMVDFTRRHSRDPLVTMCVGPYGPLSRLMLPAVGSRWVYTFLDKSSAPGQIDITTLQEHLRLMGLCN